MVFLDFINRDYKYTPEWVDKKPGACEAPNVWNRIGSGKYVLMYDVLSIQPHNFGFAEITDFVNFTAIGHFNDGVLKTTNFTSPKHGAVIQLTKKEVVKLAEHYNMNLNSRRNETSL